ncbi:MAG: hypothetical protein IJ486_05530 [Firmicutes bacterium]|nr:hypothetical protein [Bacillota bacterium]
MTELREMMETMCECAECYEEEGYQPPHMIIYLDEGEERSMAAEYVTEIMEDCGIREFGGLEHCLEYTIHGTLEELNRIACDIRRKAVYVNEFEGVVAFEGLEKISGHRDECQYDRFLEIAKEVGREATLLFFTQVDPDRNTLVLLDRLKETLGDVVNVYADEETCDRLWMEDLTYDG